MIDGVKPDDAGDYTFVPDGYALSLSAKLNFLGKAYNQKQGFVSLFFTWLILTMTLSSILFPPQRSRSIMFLVKVSVSPTSKSLSMRKFETV